MNPDLPLGKLPVAPIIPSHQPSKMTMPELEEREQIVKEGKETFVKVGLALLEIREGRGYKLRGFATFEEYIQNQFEFSRRHAYRLMDAAETAIDIKNVTNLVTIENEAQAREIRKIGMDTVLDKAKLALRTGDPKTALRALKEIIHDRREEERREKDAVKDLTPRRAPLGDAAPDAAVSGSDDEYEQAVQTEFARQKARHREEYPLHAPCAGTFWFPSPPPAGSRFVADEVKR